MSDALPPAMRAELTHWTGVVAAIADELVSPVLEQLNRTWTGDDAPKVSEGKLDDDRALLSQTLALNSLMGSRADEQAGLDAAVAAVLAADAPRKTIQDLEFDAWMERHGMVAAAPLPAQLNGLIMLLTDALASSDMREFLSTFLQELVATDPDMSLKTFANLVRDGLNADLTKPGGGFLEPGTYRIN
jgi:hypothetical protein